MIGAAAAANAWPIQMPRGAGSWGAATVEQQKTLAQQQQPQVQAWRCSLRLSVAQMIDSAARMQPLFSDVAWFFLGGKGPGNAAPAAVLPLSAKGIVSRCCVLYTAMHNQTSFCIQSANPVLQRASLPVKLLQELQQEEDQFRQQLAAPL
jgi:hypothetical protein